MTSRQEPPSSDHRVLQQDPVRLCADQESPVEPSAEWGLSLLREAAPYQSPAGRKERVWLALPPDYAYPRTKLRFALAAMALLVSGLLASAALAGWPAWLAGALDRMVSNPPPPTPAIPAQQMQQAPGEMPPAPVLVVPAASAPVATQTSDETPSARPRHAATKPASPDDMRPLLEAMRALRVERNAPRARGLLTTYLDRHPKGELSEEALVMLIEAAAAHDDSDAAALAARYLRLYPSGPFRGMVERMLAATKKSP